MSIRNFKALALALTMLGASRPLAAQATHAYSIGDVTDMVKGGLRSDRILTIIGKDCISFSVDTANTTKLRTAGADDDLLTGLRSVCSTVKSVGAPQGPSMQAIVQASKPSPRDSARPSNTVQSPGPTIRGVSQKSGLAAGTLSFLIPGVGSMYAGHQKHGWVHFGIGAMSLAAATSTDSDGNTSSIAPFGVALFLINDLWSIRTAAHDAGDYNAHATAGSAGGADSGPAVVPLASGSGSKTRVGLSLFRIQF